ncbi:MAG: helix-turn-helix domain-containing protein [Planctomycetota bacterium]
MPGTKHAADEKLPGRFDELVRLMPPQAIRDDSQLENVLEMIDRLMATRRLTRGQEIYLETLVQLVQVYEAAHHAIDTSDLRGIESLEHLLAENGMNASDLARLLGMHPSMGSKLLREDRSLTVRHVRKLARHFKVSPELFID